MFSRRAGSTAAFSRGMFSTIEVEVSSSELAARKRAWKPKAAAFGSGALWRYAQNVGPARNGAVTHPGGSKEIRVYADI